MEEPGASSWTCPDDLRGSADFLRVARYSRALAIGVIGVTLFWFIWWLGERIGWD